MVGRNIKPAAHKTSSSDTVIKIERPRRELEPEFVCIGESSILRMDFQPVLTKRFGRSHLLGGNITKKFLGEKPWRERTNTPNEPYRITRAKSCQWDNFLREEFCTLK